MFACCKNIVSTIRGIGLGYQPAYTLQDYQLFGSTIFRIVHRAMRSGGIMVTYCAKGSARRAMQAAGFEVERVVGPPHKKHMLRAVRP